MNQISSSSFRNDFPAVRREDTVWLDAAATTQVPEQVIRSITAYYEQGAASVHRGLYARAEEVTEQCEDVRARVAAWLGMPVEGVVFTSGATAGLNMVAYAWLVHRIRPGDRIVIPEFEHHANLLPWQLVAARTGAELVLIPFHGAELFLDPWDISAAITDRTVLVAIAPHNNLIGPLPTHTLEHVVAATRSVGAALLFDAAQVFAHRHPSDIMKYDPDFVIGSAHKMYGPTGVGFCAIAQRCLAEMQPWIVGGGTVVGVESQNASWRHMPALLEPGTPPVSEILGFGEAISYLQSNVIDWDGIRKREASLIADLIDFLEKVPGVAMLGNREWMRSHGHMVSFAIDGLHAHDCAQLLAAAGIAVRAGQHCNQLTHQMVGLPATVRLSCALYSNQDDIHRAVRALGEALTLRSATE